MRDTTSQWDTGVAPGTHPLAKENESNANHLAVSEKLCERLRKEYQFTHRHTKTHKSIKAHLPTPTMDTTVARSHTH